MRAQWAQEGGMKDLWESRYTWGDSVWTGWVGEGERDFAPLPKSAVRWGHVQGLKDRVMETRMWV